MKYTYDEDLISKGVARIHILGLPIYAWTLESLKLLTNNWVTIIGHKPSNLRDADFQSLVILVENANPNNITSTTKVQIEGRNYTINIFEIAALITLNNRGQTHTTPSNYLSDSDDVTSLTHFMNEDKQTLATTEDIWDREQSPPTKEDNTIDSPIHTNTNEDTPHETNTSDRGFLQTHNNEQPLPRE